MKVLCVDFALRTLSMLARDRGIGRRCRFNSFGRSTPLTPLTVPTVPTGTWLRAGPLESRCSVHRQKEQWDGHGWPMPRRLRWFLNEMIGNLENGFDGPIIIYNIYKLYKQS